MRLRLYSGRKKDSVSFLDWKPPYLVKVVAMPYPPEYKVLKFQKFDGWKSKTKHVVRFLNSMRAVLCIDLYLEEFSKYLTDRVYTWYVNLKSRTVHDWSHLVSLFNPSSSTTKLNSLSPSSTAPDNTHAKTWMSTREGSRKSPELL